MTALIIGGSGFLGTELLRKARAKRLDTTATFHSRLGDPTAATWHQLDIRDPARVEAGLTAVAPRAVIDVTSGGANWKVTADGPIHIAMATAKLGIRLVHVSGDAVFSGNRVYYDEACTPDPVTPYGAPSAIWAPSGHAPARATRRAARQLRDNWRRCVTNVNVTNIIVSRASGGR